MGANWLSVAHLSANISPFFFFFFRCLFESQKGCGPREPKICAVVCRRLLGHFIFISKATVCCPPSVITGTETSWNQLCATSLPASRGSQSAICCCRAMRRMEKRYLDESELITQLAFLSSTASKFPLVSLLCLRMIMAQTG